MNFSRLTQKIQYGQYPAVQRPNSEEAKRVSLDRKPALRNQARMARNQILDEIRTTHDRAIQNRIINHPWFINATQVLLYEAFDGEVATQRIAESAREAGKTIAYSRITATPRQLEFIRPTTWSHTSMGLPVPQGPTCLVEDDALIIVPGVLFDLNGHRLGMGGGYYDNLLSNESAPSIGLAYEAQVVDEVPTFEWDLPIDCLVTETTTYHFSDLEQKKWTGSRRLLGSSVALP